MDWLTLIAIGIGGLFAVGAIAAMLREARSAGRAEAERDAWRESARKADENAQIMAEPRTRDDTADRLRRRDF